MADCIQGALKRVAIVAPEFVPKNVAGVMRTRFLASHIASYGWQPVVLTVREEDYEGGIDPRSVSLLPSGLHVERVPALPARLCRPFGLGDVALRGQWSLRRKLAQLIRQGEVDLVFVTVLPGHASLVGAWAKRKFSVPFVLDYQDPWVIKSGAEQPRWSKAGLAHRLAAWLEPEVARRVDAFTAVSSETLDTLRERDLISSHTPVEILPIGADPADQAVAARLGRSQFVRKPDELVLAYVGTITAQMVPAAEAMFRAVSRLQAKHPSRPISLHFIGTSAQAEGKDVHGLTARARACGLTEGFHLEPRRVDYLDALRSMQEADVLLLLGSTDSHYTASKIFPAWLAGRPVFGLFHEASTVVKLAGELGGVGLVTYGRGGITTEQEEATLMVLDDLGTRGLAALAARREAGFTPYSAEKLAWRFAALFERVWKEARKS